MVSSPLKFLQDIPKKGQKQPAGGERAWSIFTGSSGEGPPSPGTGQDARG